MEKRIDLVIESDVKTPKDFCKTHPEKYTYIGRYIGNVTHIISGELIEAQGSYYMFVEENGQFILDKIYKPGQNKLLSDCSIIMDVWAEGKEKPEFWLGFTKDELEEAKEVLKQACFKFVIWVVGKEVKKEEFLKL